MKNSHFILILTALFLGMLGYVWHQEKSATYVLWAAPKSFAIADPEGFVYTAKTHQDIRSLKGKLLPFWKQNVGSFSMAELEKNTALTQNRIKIEAFTNWYRISVPETQILFFTDDFTPENLDPKLPINFESNFWVLSKSSQYPPTIPLPQEGVLLLSSGPISKALKSTLTHNNLPLIQTKKSEYFYLKPKHGKWRVFHF